MKPKTFDLEVAVDVLNDLPPRFRVETLYRAVMLKMNYCNAGATKRAVRSMQFAGLVNECVLPDGITALSITEFGIEMINAALEKKNTPQPQKEKVL